MPGDSYRGTRIASMNYLSLYGRACQKGALFKILDKTPAAVCYTESNCSET